MEYVNVVAGVNVKTIGGTPHVLMGLKVNGNWEFPGGKIEKGEIPETALIREWIEELNMTVRVGKKIDTINNSIYSVSFFHVDIEDEDDESIPAMMEHIEIEYVPLDKEMDRTMNPTNAAILERLYDEYGE